MPFLSKDVFAQARGKDIESMKKSCGEKLLNACGLYWWPPAHNDPRIKGPQPRIVTRRQYEQLMKLRNQSEDETTAPDCKPQQGCNAEETGST